MQKGCECDAAFFICSSVVVVSLEQICGGLICYRMHVAEIWRYPVKSLRGEQIPQTHITELGIPHDREIVVLRESVRRVATSRTKFKMLALQGSINADGITTVNGHVWDSTEANQLVAEACGEPVQLLQFTGPQRFDVLPLLVATDGAIAYMNVDRRRFRPNIILGGVDGLAERGWERKNIRIGDVVIHAAQLRGRCVMTTYDPDTQEQDGNVLHRIVKELDGTFALDCSVVHTGHIRLGDPVEVLG
jgi:uncharacterized protein YcbX